MDRSDAWGLPATSTTTQHYVTLEARFLPSSRRRHGGVGSRIRSLLICQPPITKLEAYAHCCMPLNILGVPDNSLAPAWRIERAKGITIGDLLEEEARIKLRHRDCANATWGKYDDQGRVVVTVTFHGSVDLDPQDPMVLDHKAQLEECGKLVAEDETHRRRIENLIAAKDHGKLCAFLTNLREAG
jgi:hypothetical protein